MKHHARNVRSEPGGERFRPAGPPVPRHPEAVTFKPHVGPHSPWIFKKMVAAPVRAPQNGAYLGLVDRSGRLVGRGFFNRKSEVAFRLLAGPEAPEELSGLFETRLEEARALRTRTLNLSAVTDAYRLINSEGDHLSGLVVDRYNATCVVSVNALGWIAHAELVEAALLRIPGVRRVLFRADDRIQKLEGFRLPELESGLVETIREGKVRYTVDLSEGHKTGLFLDQRDARARIAGLARGRRLLDLCTNAGGFALSAMVEGGALSCTAVDLDEVALGRADANARLNHVEIDFVHADLFPFVRDRIAAEERYDIVVLDPPKLARERRDLGKALKTYHDMNALALKAVAPGGILLTCSCSGGVAEPEFLGVLERAVRDAERRATVLEIRGAAPDHPVALDFPEGRYLKAVLLRVL